MAGGLNVYGFNGGDPVNFSDPFGLCEPMPSCLSKVAGGGAALGTAAAASAEAATAAPSLAAATELAADVAPPVAAVEAAAGIGYVMLKPAFPGNGTLLTRPISGALAANDATVVYSHAESKSTTVEAQSLGNRIRSFIAGLLIGKGGGMSDEQKKSWEGGEKPAIEQTQPERPKKKDEPQDP